jgi:hypothetical protein
MPESRFRLVVALLLITVFVLLVALITADQIPSATVPTPNMDQIRTEAVRTHIAELTSTATARPAPSQIATSMLSSTPLAGASGTPNCLGLRFIRDVTIPDNTTMTPADVFTKTWLVENSGTCPWRPGFQVVLIGGLAMGGSPFRVAQTVGPGGQIQVSIKMAAPTNQTGVVQGTWKMADGDGVTFGDYLSVVIVVSGPTRRPAATTQGPTVTP